MAAAVRGKAPKLSSSAIHALPANVLKNIIYFFEFTLLNVHRRSQGVFSHWSEDPLMLLLLPLAGVLVAAARAVAAAAAVPAVLVRGRH